MKEDGGRIKKIASKTPKDFVLKEIKRTIYPENVCHYID